MTPEQAYQLSMSPDARELRRLRAERRGSLTCFWGSWDPLVERARLARFWAECNRTNSAYGLVHVRPIYHNPGFRELVLPGLRAYLTARERARKQAFREQLHREAQEWQRKKAAKAAARRAHRLGLDLV
jgi:hypothetical protein